MERVRGTPSSDKAVEVHEEVDHDVPSICIVKSCYIILYLVDQSLGSLNSAALTSLDELPMELQFSTVYLARITYLEVERHTS